MPFYYNLMIEFEDYQMYVSERTHLVNEQMQFYWFHFSES